MVIFASKDIGKMTWAQIKQLAQDARSNPEQYYGYLGSYKTIELSTFKFSDYKYETACGGTRKVYLVDVVSGKTYGSARPGFVFLLLASDYAAEYYYKAVSVETPVPVYNNFTFHTCGLSGGKMYNAIQDKDFLDNLETVSFKYISGYSSLPTVDYYNSDFCVLNLSALGTASSKFVAPDMFEFIKEDAAKDYFSYITTEGAFSVFEKMKSNSLAKSVKIDYFKNIFSASQEFEGGSVFIRDFSFPRSLYSMCFSYNSGKSEKYGLSQFLQFNVWYKDKQPISLSSSLASFWFSGRLSGGGGYTGKEVALSAMPAFLCFM